MLSINYWICLQIVYSIKIFLKRYLEKSGSPNFCITWHFATFLIQCCPIRTHTSHHLFVWWVLLMFQKPMAKCMCSEDALYVTSGFCLWTIYFNSPWKHNILKSEECLLSYFLLLYFHMVPPTLVEDTLQLEWIPMKASTLWEMMGKNLSRSEGPWPWKAHYILWDLDWQWTESPFCHK